MKNGKQQSSKKYANLQNALRMKRKGNLNGTSE
jgi:hypothetical protein